MILTAAQALVMAGAASGGASATFGMQTSNGTVPGSGNRAWLGQFTAPASGVITQMHARVVNSPAGHGKFIICADNGSNVPSTVLAVSVAFSNVVGEVLAAITCPIVGGTKYWLGFVSDGSSFCDYGGNGGLASTFRQALCNGTFNYTTPPSTCPTPDANDTGQTPQVWAVYTPS